MCGGHVTYVETVAYPLGGQGGADSEKIAKNREKEGENLEKAGERGGIREKEEKSRRSCHFAPPDT